MQRPIFSIGHSTRTFEEFLSLLQEHDIALLVDVRTFPFSRRHPHFNTEVFAERLRAAGVEYRHEKALGGRRGKQPGADPSLNAGWEVPGFKNYADYALGAEFRRALDTLIVSASARPTAYMCSEAVWWRCHRRIITDHLLARGIPVHHILGANACEDASLTPFARVKNGAVTYPETQPRLL